MPPQAVSLFFFVVFMSQAALFIILVEQKTLRMMLLVAMIAWVVLCPFAWPKGHVLICIYSRYEVLNIRNHFADVFRAKAQKKKVQIVWNAGRILEFADFTRCNSQQTVVDFHL